MPPLLLLLLPLLLLLLLVLLLLLLLRRRRLLLLPLRLLLLLLLAGLAELDRMCDALLAIREEIRAIEEGRADTDSNVLRNAPHPVDVVCADDWSFPYSRDDAAYPVPGLRVKKFWPTVARLDDVYGDRNVVCSCPPMESWVN